MRFTTLFFDLDDTLYPADSGLWPVIRERISLFMHEKLGLSWQEIPALRLHLFQTYGTSMRGLQKIYNIDEKEYLDFVHDIPLSKYIRPIAGLRQVIESYPQRKWIFTNADRNHAGRVLKTLNLEGCFEEIIDILTIAPYCKPMTEAFQIALTTSGEPDPRRCVLIDDMAANLVEAHRLGFFTIHVGNHAPANDFDANIRTLIDIPSVLAHE